MGLRKRPLFVDNREYELATFRAKSGRGGMAKTMTKYGEFEALIRDQNMAS